MACLSLFVNAPVHVFAQQEEKENQLGISLSMLGHGESRNGGFDSSAASEDAEVEDKSNFLMGRTRLTVDFQKPGLQAKVTAQHSGVWGQKGQGNFNLHEAWAKLSARNGLFAQIGRQALSYDDERIIGPNDWAMAALSHDVLRMGYEGHGHKAHVILAYNQNSENISGGTFYKDGAQPYKTMHTAWYHYDLPMLPLGASVLFMNIGMQAGEKGGVNNYAPHTEYQQLLGGYLCFQPKGLKAEASYYRQFGKNEDGIKIDAWMASVKAEWQCTPQLGLSAGFDYLSGDKYFAVPSKGMIGVTRHDVIRGFNPIYGSHHKFYGLMDFFYVRTYVNGFTPGLQNLFTGVSYKPLKDLDLKLRYHYLAVATQLDDMDMTLGHDIDVEASYALMRDVRLSLGYSFMTGSKTMEKLKRADDDGSLRWGWFSLVVSPKLFFTKW